MAFVIGRSQKNVPLSLSTQNPGPGAYLKPRKQKLTEHCAPFNKSEIKTSIFEVEPTNYGPASYQPKYYKDLNQPIKVIPNSYMFMSGVERFGSNSKFRNEEGEDNNKDKMLQKQNFIGDHSKSFYQPTSQRMTVSQPKLQNYMPTSKQCEEYQKKLQHSKEAMLQLREHNNKHRVQSIKNNKDFVRVILASSTNTQTHTDKFYHKSIMGKTLGPGSYSDTNSKPKPKNITSWQRQRPIRFKTESNGIPGPGAYQKPEFQGKKNTRLSSSFACSEIRSHIDSMIYRTNIPIKAAILQRKNVKDSSPGPGSYNVNTVNKDKKSFNCGMNTNFGSEDRQNNTYSEITRKNGQIPGPGSYDNIIPNKKSYSYKNQMIKEMRNQLFGKQKPQKKHNRNKAFQSQADKQFSKGTFERKNRLNHQIYSLQERCFSKLGNMAQEERFKQNKNKSEMSIGPGEYENSHEKKLQKHLSSVFKSQTKKGAFQMNASSSKTEFYNISKNDIGFKAEKMKKYIENLRKINIERVPFETNAKRFQYHPSLQEEKDQSEKHHRFSLMDDSQGYVRKEVQVHKPVMPTSSFASKSKRNVFGRNHKHQNNNKSAQQKELQIEETVPGPGDYEVKTNYNGKSFQLQKQSFNKNYKTSKGVKNKKSIKKSQQQQHNI